MVSRTKSTCLVNTLLRRYPNCLFKGEKGDIFYMIEEGTLMATKTLVEGQEPAKVFEYKAGMYFGEISLLKNVPRQANVIATV
jgi:CRP-like cAMP-binding protein